MKTRKNAAKVSVRRLIVVSVLLALSVMGYFAIKGSESAANLRAKWGILIPKGVAILHASREIGFTGEGISLYVLQGAENSPEPFDKSLYIDPFDYEQKVITREVLSGLKESEIKIPDEFIPNPETLRYAPIRTKNNTSKLFMGYDRDSERLYLFESLN